MEENRWNKAGQDIRGGFKPNDSPETLTSDTALERNPDIAKVIEENKKVDPGPRQVAANKATEQATKNQLKKDEKVAEKAAKAQEKAEKTAAKEAAKEEKAAAKAEEEPSKVEAAAPKPEQL